MFSDMVLFIVRGIWQVVDGALFHKSCRMVLITNDVGGIPLPPDTAVDSVTVTYIDGSEEIFRADSDEVVRVSNEDGFETICDGKGGGGCVRRGIVPCCPECKENADFYTTAQD